MFPCQGPWCSTVNPSRSTIGKSAGLELAVYYLYVLQSESTGRYYVGHTKDLEARVRRHDYGRAQFTKSRGPYKVVYVKKYASRSEAAKREAQIKAKKSRPYIEQLISKNRVDLLI